RAQAFPNLTGQEIVEILLDSASDAGASGIDVVFGTGILDIAAAVAPAGTTTLGGTNSVLALADDALIGSAAMGDALDRASLSAIVTDKYDRAYTYELGSRTRNSAQVQRLRGVVERGGITIGGSSDAVSMAFTVAEGPRAGGLGWAQQLQLSAEDAKAARVLAARVAARIAPDVQLGFALSQGAGGLVAQMQGAKRPAFRIAPQASGDDGFFQSSEIALAARHQVGPWGLTISADRGDAWLGADRQAGDVITGLRERRPTSSIGLAADREIAGVETIFSLTWMQEDDTLLGAHFHDALGVHGADSLFLDAEFGREFARGWRVGAAYRHGFTRPRGNSLVGDGSQISSQAWSFDVARYGALVAGDSLGLRISQPLRVNGGALNFNLPIAYDYATESAIFGQRRLSLKPEGREVMGELAWQGPFLFGRAGASLFYRRDPGHFAASRDDAGAVVSFSAEF
ncbi:MAG: peptidase S8, partial [Pseudomonadota bacterium]